MVCGLCGGKGVANSFLTVGVACNSSVGVGTEVIAVRRQRAGLVHAGCVKFSGVHILTMTMVGRIRLIVLVLPGNHILRTVDMEPALLVFVVLWRLVSGTHML